MATDPDIQRTALTDDDRFDLQYAAASTERRNQPRALAFGAAVVLAASLLAVVFGQRSLSGAKASFARERTQESEIARLIALLESTDESAQVLVHERDPRAKLIIKNATQRDGLTGASNEPTLRPNSVGPASNGIEELDYHYTSLKSHSIEILIRSVEDSLNAIGGLEVKEIKLTPGDKEWTMDIVYSHLVKAD